MEKFSKEIINNGEEKIGVLPRKPHQKLKIFKKIESVLPILFQLFNGFFNGLKCFI